MDYKGKTVLITGAARGIGYDLAKKLSAKGAKVISFDLLQCENPLPEVEYVSLDIADFHQVEHALMKLNTKIDILVNNAGVMRRGYYHEVSDIDFNTVMSVNVKGPWQMLKLAKPFLAEDALILQMASKNARYVKENTFLYTLSKIALCGMSEMVQKTVPTYRVKTAFPGPVDTELERQGSANVGKEELEARKKITVTTEFIADWLIKLLESDQRYLIYDKDQNKYFLSNER
jgi:3-oxoacyl-[acyl-carrier protein] reductase